MKLQRRWMAILPLIALSLYGRSSHADIYRTDGSLIPGTEGISPGPDVDLSNLDLTDAGLSQIDLSRANLSQSNLTNARLSGTILTDADLTHAVVTGADLSADGPGQGLSKEQLYSTASYRLHNLQSISLAGKNLLEWNFNGQDLTGASLWKAALDHADLAGAILKATFYEASLGWADLSGSDLTDANLFNSRLQFANLTDAILAEANLSGTTALGFTKEQLYSTASYKAKDLRGIALVTHDYIPYFFVPAAQTDVSGWDFSGQNLTRAVFNGTALHNTDLTAAVIHSAGFAGTTAHGFVKEQLYSTASYEARELGAINLSSNDLTGWNLAGQNLINARFSSSDMTGADLSGADTRGSTGMSRAGVSLRNTIFPNGGIATLQLGSGETMVIRDDDPVSGPMTLLSLYEVSLTPRPAIPVRVGHGMSMDPGAVLELRLDADSWDSQISFQSGVPVQLGGVLQLTFAQDVDVAEQVGRTLQLFDWTGVSPSGQFDLQSPYRWDTTRLYSTGQVTLVAVPEPSVPLLAMAGLLALAAGRRVTSRCPMLSNQVRSGS